jgi:hypothetical protein
VTQLHEAGSATQTTLPFESTQHQLAQWQSAQLHTLPPRATHGDASQQVFAPLGTTCGQPLGASASPLASTSTGASTTLEPSLFPPASTNDTSGTPQAVARSALVVRGRT